ncbi:S8 family serine peptidase [Aromatoleum toluvorans]|uniref:S8 family serine peptidase n=1 Tax=Aromatoleum toluvorans TaxID=92002 RepID=A0ABX1PW22_9RHOO|nr:S8 family peptidase [Aromatoleum toluvorans]NMG43639.1 S8 family serine peptidase [Aromatoleum toluvorans]
MYHRPTLLALALATAFPLATFAQEVTPQAGALTRGEIAYNTVHVQVKSNLAHARGYTGRGAVVAVLDTGVQGNHIELNTQLVGTTMYDASIRATVAQTDGDGHGTHVAGIVAGSTGTGYSYGIAPDAKVLPVKVFTSGTWTASSTALAIGLNTAAANPSVSVVNMSLGGSSPLGATFETSLRSAIAADKLIVAAAGNNGGAAPIWPARYAKESWAKGQIIAVGAVDANNQIASFSNRAGDTANWFIVAPGVRVVSSYNNGGYVYMSGTSMATPVVAGAAALLEGAWPQLKAAQVASILFQTATDLGTPGVDAIYGWGLLNVDRAMQPVGTLAVPVSSSTTTLKRSSATLRSSVASWSGLRSASRAGQFRGITVDAFNRDFNTDYGSGIRAPAVERIADALAGAGRALRTTEQRYADGSRLVAMIEEQRPDALGAPGAFGAADGASRSLVASSAVFKLAGGKEFAFASGGLAGSYFGLADTDSSLANPYLGLARSSAQFAFGYQEGALSFKAGVLDAGLNAAQALPYLGKPAEGGRAAIGELDYALGRDTMVGMQMADVSERSAWLGSVAGDALALDQARTRTLTAHASHRLGRDTLVAAQYSFGTTNDAQGRGLLTSTDAVRSEAFAIGVVSRNAFTPDDRLAVALSSPMRITRGSANVTMPVAITEAGDTVFESRRVSLAAPSRELKLGLDYVTPLSKTANLSWLVALRHNANHVAGERETQAGVVYRTSF